MPEMIFAALKDAAVDTVKLIPFLFVTYLLMEALERKTSDHSVNLISNVGRFGPVAGAVVGIVPQCGFSAAAASLYSGGLVRISFYIRRDAPDIYLRAGSTPDDSQDTSG